MTSPASFATALSPTSSTLLTSSISSLSSSSTRQASSQISKIYRQASTLFLTRRLPESLSTILPVITPAPIDDTNANPEPAPISKAGKTTRIKVWSLYLTILNAVVELDPDEGKQAFGSTEWRGLVSKVRDGDIWEEVVKNGYGGAEGDVDSDVVINLATLLLAHARTQKVNQTRLETYLATSTTPNLDISSRLQSSRPPSSRGLSPTKGSRGTDTPRDLNSRVKILELYTLHVLLRNNEWSYAREFITISSVLDEERREAFLQALQSLQDEQKENERREKEEARYQEEQVKREVEEARRKRAEVEEKERKKEAERERNKGGSEVDYGVDDTPTSATFPPRPSSRASKASTTTPSKTQSKKAPSQTATSPIPRSAQPAHPIPAKNKKAQAQAPPNMLTRAGNVLTNVKKLIETLAASFKTRPLFLLQMLAFIVGFVVVLSRRNVKERVKRILGGGWDKVRATAGMGVKVSYI